MRYLNDQTGGDPNRYNLPVAARLALALSRKAPIHFPDAIGWTPLNADIIGLAGTEISVGSKINLLNGVDRGQSVKVNLDIGTGIGWDQGVSGIRTEYYFLGDYSNFNADDFFGSRVSMSIGASFGVEVGYGMTYMNVDGGFIVGISKYIGFSPPGISGNINYGDSYGW